MSAQPAAGAMLFFFFRQEYSLSGLDF